ncbi:MAG: glycosyltransferase [Gloeocapsa sp. UFS-A4-WI-NPMV-4B04]|jgi:glycosyltransferase involved in cell wall biosynthesis|nr:glycosyltransferase [Gloeocapsa sp. UFS-A4-WI-NPMV-4B04]
MQKICGGRRFLKQRSFDKASPSISIITVTYNRITGLRETFDSTISQTYRNIEYIVIDGGSKDGTVNFLQENDEAISFWLSEKDAGIYDAMNKGAELATGDWIIFMNSGDEFLSKNTLTQVSAYLNNSVDVVYGGFESILADKYQIRVTQNKPRALSDIWCEIPTCHQSIFIKRKLQVQYAFNSSFTWCADHDLLVRVYADGYQFKEIPVLIAKFDACGGDGRDLLSYTKERWLISKRLASPLKRYRYFLREYYNFFIWKNISMKIRDILPLQWVIALRKYRGTY